LNGKVLAALSKQKNLNPRPGWIRAENIPGPEVLAEVATLSKEVARLTEENSVLKQKASIEAQFSLIDAMADDAECQAAILMLETGKDIAPGTPFAIGYESGGGSSGGLGGSYREKLVNAGVFRLGGNRVWRLTDEGRRFAEWLVKKRAPMRLFLDATRGLGRTGSEYSKRQIIPGYEQECECLV
jgi:hypothetical protein